MPQEEKRGSWTYEILSNNVQEISKINDQIRDSRISEKPSSKRQTKLTSQPIN